jgi:PAS domain S-box-containing protein
MDGRSGAGHLMVPPTTVRTGPTSAPMPAQPFEGRHHPRVIARRELLVLVVACLWSFDIAWHYDLTTSVVDWARRHEASGVGDLFVLLVAGFLGLALIAWRRYLHELGEARELDRTQRELALTTERYQSLFEFHTSAVFSMDFVGRFTATNEACSQITGYDAAELREMTFYDLLERDHVDETEAAFRGALEREPQRLEAAVIHADGHLVDLAVTGLPIVVDDVVVGVYGIAEDITEAKEARRELVRHRAEARQANEAKSLFLANMSHEIRAPLNSLLGMSDLLRDSGLDDAQLALVDSMDCSGQRLLALVNQILEFSQFEVSTSSGNAVPFDVRLLAGEVAALMRPSAERKELFFKCTVGPGIPELVYGDPAKIAQVLTHLMDNAIRFTDAGWVRLVVTNAHHFGDQVSIRFEVHDSGIGAIHDQERRRYLAFSEVTRPAPGNYAGTGVGLAISQQLVTGMGGAIGLSSTPGLGSALSFTLRFTLPSDS